MTTGNKRVFISHARSDDKIASTIRERLATDGFAVFSDWSLLPGDSIVERIDREIMSSDIVLILVSSSSIKSAWVQHEIDAALSASLDAREVTVIPLLVDGCEMPPPLSTHAYLDLRGGLEQAVEQIKRIVGNLRRIDFSSLSPFRFERFACELLVSAGYTLVSSHVTTEGGSQLDFVVRPPGSDENWIVEVKLYRAQRVGVRLLHELIGQLVSSGQYQAGLIVTNGQLTSVARDFLANMRTDLGIKVSVLDGPDLHRLAVQHPEVLSEYFPSPSGSKT